MIRDKFQMNKIDEIKAMMQKNEAAADALGLVVIKVSKRRHIVAKFGGADEGVWHATQVFRGTAEACADYIKLHKGGAS